MSNEYIVVKQSLGLNGKADLVGAKNAVLVIMASLILTSGKSRLTNVPCSADVLQMIKLLESLGAQVFFDKEDHVLEVDTSTIDKYTVPSDIMSKMRASVLVMGPLLARFGQVNLALPGGCVIGARPIDYHLKNFEKMGAVIDIKDVSISAQVKALQATKIMLDYPSVGATENVLMAAVCTQGKTTIVNAALEPEVCDLITVLQKMGAKISTFAPATIEVEGVAKLNPIEHAIIFDRLEAGALLLAAAITGGQIELSQAPAYALDMFLMKLQEMGHDIKVGADGVGIILKATKTPRAVSFETGPYPGFPTDLQAPMMALQCVAQGTACIRERVFENRLLHVSQLQKMGAQVKIDHTTAMVTGVPQLYGASVIASDIRASCALVLAGLVAEGKTIMHGVHHWKRGYDRLEQKLANLGASIKFVSE